MKRALLTCLRVTCLPVALLATVATGCASHNAHRIRVEPGRQLEPLVDQAVEAMRTSLGTPLPEGDVALAAAVEDLDLAWEVAEPGAAGPNVWTSPDLRHWLEEEVVRQLGEAVVETGAIEEARHRFDGWLLADLRQPDAVTLQVFCVLTHRDEPGRVLAEGWSEPVTLPRVYCHGCREHPFRDTGTRIHSRRVSGGSGGVTLGVGLSHGSAYLHGYHDHHGSGPVYVKVRR